MSIALTRDRRKSAVRPCRASGPGSGSAARRRRATASTAVRSDRPAGPESSRCPPGRSRACCRRASRSSRKSSNCPQVSSNHSHIAQYLAISSVGCLVAVLGEESLAADCGANGASSGAYQRKNGARAFLGHVDEVEDGLHPLPPDREPEVAVPAAASRVAVGHSVREPAALVRAAPPLARLEAQVAATRRASAAGSACRQNGRSSPAARPETPGVARPPRR